MRPDNQSTLHLRPAAERPAIWTQPEPGAHWLPEVKQIYAYWRSIHPENGTLPGRQHFEPARVISLLSGVWLLDVVPTPFRLRYRLAGTRVTASIGREVTGQWMDEAHPDALKIAGYFDRYRGVVETGQPSWRRGRSQLWIHEDYSCLENILLPLARDGLHVDMLLAFTGMHDQFPPPPADNSDVRTNV